MLAIWNLIFEIPKGCLVPFAKNRRKILYFAPLSLIFPSFLNLIDTIQTKSPNPFKVKKVLAQIFIRVGIQNEGIVIRSSSHVILNRSILKESLQVSISNTSIKPLRVMVLIILFIYPIEVRTRMIGSKKYKTDYISRGNNYWPNPPTKLNLLDIYRLRLTNFQNGLGANLGWDGDFTYIFFYKTYNTGWSVGDNISFESQKM